MNEPTTQDAKLKQLFNEIDRKSRERSHAMMRNAQIEADEIIAEAYHNARQKVHEAIVQERTRGARAIDKQKAQIETDKRQTLQTHENEFLSAAWQRLDDALEGLWQDDDMRAHWIETTLQRGAAHLHTGAWVIEHPSELDTAELERHAAWIESLCGNGFSLEANVEIKAGLKITANQVCVDTSVQGLTANKQEVSALLLAEYFQGQESGK